MESGGTVYQDIGEEKKVLEFIRQNGKLPPNYIKSLGTIRRIRPSGMKGVTTSDFVTLPSEFSEAARTLEEYSMLLLAQGSRKTKDIILSLENLALSGEELLVQNLESPVYNILNKSVIGVYRLIGALPKDSDAPLKESIKSKPNLLEFHKKSHQWVSEKMRPYAESMLRKSPEFESSIGIEELTELLINAPVVTAAQIRDRDNLPSDVVLQP